MNTQMLKWRPKPDKSVQKLGTISLKQQQQQQLCVLSNSALSEPPGLKHNGLFSAVRQTAQKTRLSTTAAPEAQTHTEWPNQG